MRSFVTLLLVAVLLLAAIVPTAMAAVLQVTARLLDSQPQRTDRTDANAVAIAGSPRSTALVRGPPGLHSSTVKASHSLEVECDRRLLGTVLTYLTLEFAAMMGVPVRPEHIQEMTRLLKQSTAVRVERQHAGDDPPPGFLPTDA